MRLCLVALLLAACATTPPPPAETWAARYDAAHPLAGRIWSPARAAFVDRATLLETLAAARVVVLGERHDHPDHHRLQAALVDALLAGGRFRAVAFEMLDEADAPALQPGMRPDLLAKAVEWQASGWPAFELYQPIFAVAHLRGAALVAASPSKETVRGEPPAGLPLAPLPPAAEADLAAEIRDGHCGMLPEAAIAPMAAIQRLKDAFMAARVAPIDGVVLVAGNGHARADRGVPLYLERLGVAPVATVGFVEAGPPEAADYGALPYDFVWFTPRVDDVDPCDRFREQLQRLRDR